MSFRLRKMALYLLFLCSITFLAPGCFLFNAKPDQQAPVAPTNVSYVPYQTFETAYEKDFTKMEDGFPLPEWDSNLFISSKRMDVNSMTSSNPEIKSSASQNIDFPENFTMDIWFGFKGCGEKNALSIQLEDSRGKAFNIDFYLITAGGPRYNVYVSVNGKERIGIALSNYVSWVTSCGRPNEKSGMNHLRLKWIKSVFTLFLNDTKIDQQYSNSFANFTKLTFNGLLHVCPIAKIHVVSEADSEPITVSNKTLEDAHHEYLLIKNDYNANNIKCHKEYSQSLKTIDAKYKEKYDKAIADPRSQFETESEYQKRLEGAKIELSTLRSEHFEEKRLLQLSPCGSTQKVIEDLETKMRTLTLSYYKLSDDNGVKLELDNYLAENQMFPVVLKATKGQYAGIYRGYMPMPVSEAKKYFENQNILAVKALGQISTKSGCPFLSKVEILANDTGKTYLVNLSEYFVTTDNSIIHKRTGLEWFPGPNRRMARDDGIKWLRIKKLEKGGGWRLPSYQELRTIYEPDKIAGGTSSHPAHLDPVFSKIGSGSDVWTSKIPKRPYYYWYYIDFETGAENHLQKHMSGGSSYRVFAVRSWTCE